MAKANEYVVDALEDLVVQADEAPIEASEGRAVLRILNDMMAMWEAVGIDLGYTPVDNLGEDITIPDGAKIGVKAHLAFMIADKYDVDTKPSLVRKMVEGWEAILNIAVDIEATAYPSTLPQGSGNDSFSYADNTFFQPSEDDV
jgi:hypothetical protein